MVNTERYRKPLCNGTVVEGWCYFPSVGTEIKCNNSLFSVRTDGNWLEWRFRVPIGNNGAMHFSGYPKAYNHAYSLHVYFWHIWVPCIPIRTRNCVNTLIHILYNFQTIWVQCISVRTQNCINTLVHFLYIYYTIWVQARTLTDVVADVISWLLSLNVNKIK